MKSRPALGSGRVPRSSTARGGQPRRRLALAALALAALALALMAQANEARADRRIFGFTYPYMTLPRGGFEIEHYLDVAFSRVDDPATADIFENGFRPTWRHQIELEYGITDKWDLGFYNVFRQRPFESFQYRGVKLRSRYRFLEEGQWLIDPAIYLEAAFYGDEVELEQRLIIARNVGRLAVALNFKFEEELKFKPAQLENGRLRPAETELELVFNPTLGVGWHFNEHAAVGLEYFAQVTVEHGELEHFTHFLGPTFSVATRHFWWTVTFQPQLGDVSGQAAFQIRSLFAFVP